MNILIYGALGLLAWWTLYLMIERALVLFRRREADGSTLGDIARTWRRLGRLGRTGKVWGRLGWLRPLLEDCGLDHDALGEACRWERREVERYEGAFLTTGSLAMALGLLGTFLALRENALSGASPAQVIGLGMGTSTAGLVINILATFCEAVLRRRSRRLLYQIDTVVDTLDELREDES